MMVIVNYGEDEWHERVLLTKASKAGYLKTHGTEATGSALWWGLTPDADVYPEALLGEEQRTPAPGRAPPDCGRGAPSLTGCGAGGLPGGLRSQPHVS